MHPIYGTGIYCILCIFFQQLQVPSILNMLHTLRFSLQNAVYFIMLPFFGSCIIHILHTGVLKFKRKTPVPKG